MADHMHGLYPYHLYHHGHHGHHEGLEELILSNAMHSGHSSLQSDIHTASVNGLNATAEAARDTVDAVRDAISATNNIGNLNLSSTERNGGESRATTERAAGVIRDQIAQSANQAARDHGTLMGELCDVRKEMSDGFGTTQLEMVKGHGKLELEMCKQHADLAAKLAECCCEVKELVRAENSATRELMQSQELDNANRRASEAQNELNLLKIQAGVLGGLGRAA